MRSSKNTRAVVIGIFVVVGLLIFVLGVITLTGQKKSFSDAVNLKAIFDNVEGLQAGSNVWLNGVKIGTVRDVSFNEDGRIAVSLGVDEKMQAYIHKDAKAKVGSDGLIGNRIIVIYGGTPSSPTVNDGDILAVEKIAGMEDMMATFQSNNENLLAITGDFKAISSKLASGQGTIGKLLNDESLGNSMELAMANLQRASSGATEITKNLSDYTSKLQQEGTLTNDLITDTVIFSQFRRSVAEIEKLSQSANEVMNTLQSATTAVNAGISDKETPAGILLHDKETAASLKTTIKNLETSTKKLDENMEALQHNFLLRGFFRKRDKEAAKENE